MFEQPTQMHDDYAEEYDTEEEGEGSDDLVQPQKLPMETIMEENSELGKIKPPKKVKAAKRLKEIKEVKEVVGVKETVREERRIKHKFPEMSENERKLAETDAYLRKLESRKPQQQQH
jgi:hypothetical protein